jgi:hypothetical protein
MVGNGVDPNPQGYELLANPGPSQSWGIVSFLQQYSIRIQKKVPYVGSKT